MIAFDGILLFYILGPALFFVMKKGYTSIVKGLYTKSEWNLKKWEGTRKLDKWIKVWSYVAYVPLPIYFVMVTISMLSNWSFCYGGGGIYAIEYLIFGCLMAFPFVLMWLHPLIWLFLNLLLYLKK